MKLIPFGQRVLVKLLTAADRTKSGVILPGHDQENVVRGNVLATGIDSLAVGDTLLLAKNAGYRWQQDGVWLIIVSGDDILAVIKQEG